MKNTIAFVTGGAGHIGRETCIKLADEGSTIIVVDKDEESGKSFVKDLNEKYGTENMYLNLNLLEESCFVKAYEEVKKKYGRLTYLVNCAAFYDDTPGWGVPFEEESYDAWLKVLKVNTLAPFFLAQKLSPLMKNEDHPGIVNVSSIYGVVAPDFDYLYGGTKMTNPAVYGVSKGGLQQATKWLSSVLAPKIRVNTVTPGGVERGQDPTFKDKYEKRTPLNRMANEEDIANAITYLLSPKAKYITGHNLMVDGGWTVW